jgi:enterochelin esterase-like enzyme
MNRHWRSRPTLTSRRSLLVVFGLLLEITACTGPGDLPTMVQAVTLPTVTPSTAPPETVTTVNTKSPEPDATATPTWTVEPTALPSATPSSTPTPGCDEDGQIESGRFPSSLARPDLAYRIYLPPCYGRDNHVYPVLYMLPGNIHDDSIWDQLGLDETAETGIQDGILPPMILVMPEGGSIANETSGGPYSYEGVIVNELRTYIESNYCAWKDATGRAIGGLSRGGYWSLEIAFRNPALFSSAGGHSAALVDTYAGPTLDPKYTASTSDLTTLRIYLDAGQSDWYLSQLQILHENLLAAGKEHAWIIQEGSHNDDYWSAHTADYLAWYAEPWMIERDQLPLCTIDPAG